MLIQHSPTNAISTFLLLHHSRNVCIASCDPATFWYATLSNLALRCRSWCRTFVPLSADVLLFCHFPDHKSAPLVDLLHPDPSLNLLSCLLRLGVALGLSVSPSLTSKASDSALMMLFLCHLLCQLSCIGQFFLLPSLPSCLPFREGFPLSCGSVPLWSHWR